MAKKFLRIFIVLAVLAAASYYSFNLVMSAVIHTKKEMVLPDVKGKNIVEAVEELSAAGLGLRKEGEEFNQNVPPGVILRQSPPAGMNVREGKVIKVTISQGGETIYVPQLVGQTVRAADITLKSATLMIGEISRKYSVIAEKGIVLSQDPAAGSSVDKDAVINITISDGLPPEGTVLMPDFINKDGAEAKAWAVNAGITVEMKRAESTQHLPDTVMKQIPEPDTDLSGLGKVVFVIAKKSKEDENNEIVFNYSLPNSGGNKRIKLVLVDDNGEKDILNAVRKPGTQISIPLQVSGKAVVKVYVNKTFIEDVELQ